MYRMYAIGQFWFFITLEDSRFTVSKAYDATDDKDILEIYALLTQVKHYIQVVYHQLFEADF